MVKLILYVGIHDGDPVIGVMPEELSGHELAEHGIKSPEVITFEGDEMEHYVAEILSNLEGMTARLDAQREGDNYEPVCSLLSRVALEAYKLGQKDSTKRESDHG